MLVVVDAWTVRHSVVTDAVECHNLQMPAHYTVTGSHVLLYLKFVFRAVHSVLWVVSAVGKLCVEGRV